MSQSLNNRPNAGSVRLEDIIRRLMDAQFQSLFNLRFHVNRALLTLSWKETDTSSSKDSDEIRKIMETKFGFATERFEIPSRDPLRNTNTAIEDFIAKYQDHYSRSLLVFHYAGHGKGIPRGLLLAGKRDGHVIISFHDLRATMLKCKADVLILLDCCNAAAGFRSLGGRTVEILAACPENEFAFDGNQSFTLRFCRVVANLASQGMVSVGKISREMRIQFPSEPTPSLDRLEGNGPICLDPVTGTGSNSQTLDPTYISIEIRITDETPAQIRRRLQDCLPLLKVNDNYCSELSEIKANGKESRVTLKVPLPLDYPFDIPSSPSFNEIINTDPVARAIRLHHLAENYFPGDRMCGIEALRELAGLLRHWYGKDSITLLSVLPKLASEYEAESLFLDAARERERALEIIQKHCKDEWHLKSLLYLYLAGRAYVKAKLFEKGIYYYEKMVYLWSLHPEVQYLSLLTLRDIKYDIKSLKRKLEM